MLRPFFLKCFKFDLKLLEDNNLKNPLPHRVESSFLKPETIQLGPVRRGHGQFLSPEIYSDEALHPGDPWQCPITESGSGKGL